MGRGIDRECEAASLSYVLKDMPSMILEYELEGPDKQIQIGVAQILSENFLIAVYFSHLPVFSYKNLNFCREFLMLFEYHQKFGIFRLH